MNNALAILSHQVCTVPGVFDYRTVDLNFVINDLKVYFPTKIQSYLDNSVQAHALSLLLDCPIVLNPDGLKLFEQGLTQAALVFRTNIQVVKGKELEMTRDEVLDSKLFFAILSRIGE